VLVNGNINDIYTDTNAQCFATFEFKQGYIAILDRVKIFLDYTIIDKVATFNGKLKLQGSNDGTTFIDILTID